MTDNEIVKTLECCAEDKCRECPLLNDDCGEVILCKNALDLINRQKAEIERLEKDRASLIEHLKKSRKQTKTAKAEAIKEFAERVKVVVKFNYIVWDEQIDYIVKEMVGDAD